MSYIMVMNRSKLPIHAALSWSGIQQQCHNDIIPDSSRDFVVGAGWHDLTIVPGSPSVKFARSKNNKVDLGKLIVDAVEWTGIGATVRFGITGRADDSLYRLGMVEPDGKDSSQMTIVGDLRLNPVVVTGLYAPDGYTVTVHGGEIEGTYDEADDTFTIKSATPLSLDYRNRQSGSKGHRVARP